MMNSEGKQPYTWQEGDRHRVGFMVSAWDGEIESSEIVTRDNAGIEEVLLHDASINRHFWVPALVLDPYPAEPIPEPKGGGA